MPILSMNEEARQILIKALDEHRDQMLQNRACCLGLLKDYGRNQHPEAAMLADCVEHGVARRLSELARKKVDLDVITAIADDFHAKTFYDAELCRWAVESWAIGFDVKHPSLSSFKRSTKSTTTKLAPPAQPPRESEEVSFDLKQTDLDGLKHYLQSKSNEDERQRRYLHFISAAIGVLVAIVATSHWWSHGIAFVVTWVLLFYAVRGILWSCEWLEKHFAKGKTQTGVLSRHTIKISNEGIFETTPLDSQSCTWAVVSWFHVDPKHLFIAVPSGIHVIPFRAFESDVKKGLNFVALTKSFFEGSRANPRTGKKKPHSLPTNALLSVKRRK
jgi:hypothetical protein